MSLLQRLLEMFLLRPHLCYKPVTQLLNVTLARLPLFSAFLRNPCHCYKTLVRCELEDHRILYLAIPVSVLTSIQGLLSLFHTLTHSIGILKPVEPLQYNPPLFLSSSRVDE